MRAVFSDVEAERRYEALCRALREEFPGFALRNKRGSRLHRAIDVALRVLTLGAMRTYLSGYQTTIGRSIYVTDGWDRLPPIERYATLLHEAVHLRQFRRYGLVGMAILYLLVPLPMGLSYFRMRMEREAYEASLSALYEALGEGAVRDPRLREAIVSQFTSAAYGWMWPFRADNERWYDGVVERLSRGE